MLINYSILEPIGNFIQITAGMVFAWDTAGGAAKTAVDGLQKFLSNVDKKRICNRLSWLLK